MKIICLQENLKTALGVAERIIGKNLTLPILNNILLKTDKGKLKISSTNLEIGVNFWAAGKVEKEGEITVPAKVFASIISQLPNQKIEIETKENTLLLKCENYKAKINGQDAKEFPIIPQIQPQTEVVLGAEDLRNGLAQVSGLAAISGIRPEISGILFLFEKNNLKLAATDSFRLGEKNIFLKNPTENHSIIVPQRTAQELMRILSEQASKGEKNTSVKIIIGVSQAMFDLGYVQLISRLIDGQYPDYQQIIPANFQTKITLEKEEFIKAIRVASLFSSKINDVKVKIFPAKKQVEIFSQNIDIGENISQIKAEGEGKTIEISFNWRYLLDGLNNINSEEVFFGLNNEATAAVLKPKKDESYVYVVMPIRAS